MSESVARTGVSRLSFAVAILAFALIVVAGADLRAAGTDTCAGWGDCSGWTYLTSESNAIGRLHLAVAGLTGLASIALIALAWLRLRDDLRVMRAAIATLALIGVQVVAVMLPGGGSAATWGATTHLGATALLLALAIYISAIPAWQSLRAAALTSTASRDDRTYPVIVGWSVAAVFAVLISGAYLTADGNATDCGGWPVCDTAGASGIITADAHGLHRVLVVSAGVLLVTLAVQTIALTTTDTASDRHRRCAGRGFCRRDRRRRLQCNR